MSAPFKVGDVVIGQNFINQTYRNGMECEVIGELAPRIALEINTGAHTTKMRYRVRWADGDITAQGPSYLRRRPPSDSHERTYMQKWRDMAGKAPQRVGETA